jgi:hypothetical protein
LGSSGIALAILCALGAVLGIVFLGGLGGVLTGYPVGGLLFGLTIGLGFGLTVVPAVVLASGLVDETDIRTQDPRSIIRDDLAFGLAVMLMLGLTVILPIRLMGEIMGGFALLLVLGGLANLVSEIGFGMAGFRYLALLLCTAGGANIGCPGGWDDFSPCATRPGWCASPATVTSSVTENSRTTWPTSLFHDPALGRGAGPSPSRRGRLSPPIHDQSETRGISLSRPLKVCRVSRLVIC